MPSSQPMAIASILGPDTSVYAPSLRYMSSGDHHATQAAQVPSPEVNPPSPVEDPALPAPDAESVAAAMLLQAMRHEYVEHNVCEDSSAVTEGDSLARNAAESLLQLRTKGDSSACNAAESLLQLRTKADAIFLKTNTERCECGDYRNGNVTFCEDADCLSDVSHSSDEDPFPSPEATKITCHGTELPLHAHEGNALFDIPLDRHDESTSLPCRRCEKLIDVYQKAWYAEGYRKLGYDRFQREDTISSDDTTEPQAPATSSPRPKLRLTIKKLALDKSTRSPEHESSSSNTSASNSDDADGLSPSSSNTSISLASPPSTHDPRSKKGSTTSPLKQVENASSSPTQRDSPSSATTYGNRPLYMLRDRTSLRRTSKGRDLPNDVGVRASLASPAQGEKSKEEALVTDASFPPMSARRRARWRRITARMESMASLPPPQKRNSSHLEDSPQPHQPPPTQRQKHNHKHNNAGKPNPLPLPSSPTPAPPSTNPYIWTTTPLGTMVRSTPDVQKMNIALAQAKRKEVAEKKRRRKEAMGMNGGFVSIFPRGG